MSHLTTTVREWNHLDRFISTFSDMRPRIMMLKFSIPSELLNGHQFPLQTRKADSHFDIRLPCLCVCVSLCLSVRYASKKGSTVFPARNCAVHSFSSPWFFPSTILALRWVPSRITALFSKTGSWFGSFMAHFTVPCKSDIASFFNYANWQGCYLKLSVGITWWWNNCFNGD